MQIQIPPILLQMARNPEVKRAFFLEYAKQPLGCDNCNGSGVISLFLATNGPFDGPGNKDKYVSKFHDGKFWCAPSGQFPEASKFGTISAQCPVCKGKGRKQ